MSTIDGGHYQLTPSPVRAGRPDAYVVEVFASDESGTWTIVITLPNGMTCLVAAGNAFQDVEGTPLTPDEKA